MARRVNGPDRADPRARRMAGRARRDAARARAPRAQSRRRTRSARASWDLGAVSSPDLRTSDAARRAMRRYLEARDGRGCGRCGDPIDRRETASIGHIVARARGGSDGPGNLRLEHLSCNQRAGADDGDGRDRALVRDAMLAYLVELDEGAGGPLALAGPGLSEGAHLSGRAAAAWNGARNRAGNRTIVLMREDPRR